jgi:hypothetical protein
MSVIPDAVREPHVAGHFRVIRDPCPWESYLVPTEGIVGNRVAGQIGVDDEVMAVGWF